MNGMYVLFGFIFLYNLIMYPGGVIGIAVVIGIGWIIGKIMTMVTK